MQSLKLKNIGNREVIIFTGIALLFFTGWSLLHLRQLDKVLTNICEERHYTDWITIENKRVALTEQERRDAQKKINECERSEGLICLFIEDEKQQLAQGYKLEQIRTPDEKRRAISRKEFQNYEHCINDQLIAKQKRSTVFSTLGIVDGAIFGFGVLIFLSSRRQSRNFN